MRAAALKLKAQRSNEGDLWIASDRKAYKLIARSRYQPPTLTSFTIAETAQTGPLSMIGNVGEIN